MRYALIDGTKREAEPKHLGLCPNCLHPVIAKCGRVKVWHWAHKGRPPCDPWWEAETEWHRTWKDNFPAEWQEVGHVDSITGERHIADIKNPYGLVVELQHSKLDRKERESREQFYKEMIWIVDGTRGPLDASYFDMGLEGPIQNNPLAYRIRWWGRSRLLNDWSEARAKVYLDFGTAMLWRLVLFDPKTNIGAVGPLPKSALIEDCIKGTSISVGMLP